MPDDDFRFTTELARLDASKLDRAEAREIEGLYRAKEYLAAQLRDRRAADRDRSPVGRAGGDAVAPDGVVAALGDAIEDVADADYTVGRLEVELDASVVDEGDGPVVRVSDPTTTDARDGAGTLRVHLRPTDSTAGEGTVGYEAIPDVRDRPAADARDAVERAGFDVGEVTTEFGDTDGVVLDQHPSPRTVAEPGTAIDLTVSERREVDVPPVTGYVLADAMTALEAAGLDVGEVDAETREEPADAVVGQTPSAGEAVPVGSRIDLTVSAGTAEPQSEPGSEAASRSEPGSEPESESESETGSGPESESESETGTKPARESEQDVGPVAGPGRPDDATGADDRPGLRAVDGIGPTYADRLHDAGVDDLPTLLGRDVADVASITDAAPGRVEGWFDQARQLVGE